MADREFRARFTADTSNLESGANRAETKLAGLGAVKLDSITNLAEKALEAGEALWNMAEGAAEDEKAAAALAKTLANTAGATDAQVSAVEDWISAQGRALGVTDDQLRPALDALSRGTHDVDESMRLASIAMDVSAGTGKDLTAVSEALAKAYNGQLGPLKKLDPALADLIKQGASTDEVFAALSATFEGQAATAADTTAGKMARAQVAFGELQEEIGAKVLPVLVELGNFLLDYVIPALEDVVAWVEANWPRWSQAIADGVTKLTELWQTYGQPVLDQIVAAVTTFIDVAVALWDRFGSSILTVLAGAWEQIRSTVETAINVVRDVINIVTALIHGDWGKAWDGIRQLVVDLWEGLKGIISGALDVIQGVLSGAWAAITGVVSSTWDGIKATISGAIGEARDAVTGALDTVQSTWETVWSAVETFVSDTWTNIKGYVSGGIDDVVGFVEAIPGRIADFIDTAFDAIPDAFKSAINAVIDAWNGIRIPGFGIHQDMPGPIPDLDFDWDGLDLPNIPRLHSGGIFDSGRGEGLALLRDGEGVFTPDQMTAMGGGNVYQITVVNEAGSDLAEAGRRVVDAIAAFEARNGAAWRNGERAA